MKLDNRQGFLLFVPPGAEVRPLSNVATSSDFEHLVRFIAEQRSSSLGPFSAWLRAMLDCSDPMAREESTRLFHSYQAFCAVRAVPIAQRMNTTSFGRALTRCGITTAKSGRGRVLRIGCQLRGDGQ